MKAFVKFDSICNSKIINLKWLRLVFLHMYATHSELPSNIGTKGNVKVWVKVATYLDQLFTSNNFLIKSTEPRKTWKYLNTYNNNYQRTQGGEGSDIVPSPGGFLDPGVRIVQIRVRKKR